MESMRKQAERYGTKFIADMVEDIDVTQRPFPVTLASGEKLTADTIVISTGADAKWLGIESEQKYMGLAFLHVPHVMVSFIAINLLLLLAAANSR